jgi:cell division protein FtsA
MEGTVNEKIISALDLGSGSVKIVIAELTENGPLIVGFGESASKGINKGIVVDLDKTTEAIIDAKQKAENMSGKKISSVTATVSGTHIHSVNNKGTVIISREGREITRDDVRRAEESAKVIMLQPNQEIIHTLPRQFIIDGQGGIRNAIGMSGIKLEEEVHIITGSSTVLRNIRKCVKNAELYINEFVLHSVASSYAALRDEEKELGVALLDIGAGTTDLIVFSEGNISFTEVFPMAGEYITKDIAYGLRVSLEEAERIKKDFGFVSSGDEEIEGEIEISSVGSSEKKKVSKAQISDIVTARVDEIFENIRFELTKLGQWGNMPAGIVITGGSANLKGIAKRASEIFETPVRIGKPGDGEMSVDMLGLPQYSASVGLIRYMAESGKVRKKSFSVWKDLSWLKDIFE